MQPVGDRTEDPPAAPAPGPGRSTRRLAEIALLVLLVALPLVTNDTFFIDRVGRYFLFAIFAISVDLIWGY
ncbi:MAG: hypothetical protein PVI35_03190, partial [Acidimicrobiia bacterium]